MSRPHALRASAAPTSMFDWNSAGPSAYPIARAQFMHLVSAAAAADDSQAAFRSGSVRSDVDPRDVVPDGWTVRGDWQTPWGSLLVVEEPTARTLALIDGGDGDGLISVEVFSPEGGATADVVLRSLLDASPTFEVADDRIEVRFWTLTSMGPRSYVRLLDAPSWDNVAGNYAAGLRDELTVVHRWKAPPNGGRLLLAHGPVGTGKTTVLRTLASAWRDWADVHYVVDPDEFFGHASYMVGVLLGDDFETDSRWRLIVVEDCDELLTEDAKSRSGQAVARLLNVCDGMVGQGLRVMLALTTNEPVNKFHDAITRPGRCLRNLYLGRLSSDDADAWRAEHGVPPTGADASLAELYAEERVMLDGRAQHLAAAFRRGDGG